MDLGPPHRTANDPRRSPYRDRRKVVRTHLDQSTGRRFGRQRRDCALLDQGQNAVATRPSSHGPSRRLDRSADGRPQRTAVKISKPRRKRGHVGLGQKLAAALACLLPAAQRDGLRERKVPAKQVIRLFTFDHLVLHAMDGSDLWWNLDPKLVAAHREKTKADVGIVAKVRRIAPQWNEFLRNMARPDRGQPQKKRRKLKMTHRCPYCHYKVTSGDNHYIKIRMLMHQAKAHPKERPDET